MSWILMSILQASHFNLKWVYLLSLTLPNEMPWGKFQFEQMFIKKRLELKNDTRELSKGDPIMMERLKRRPSQNGPHHSYPGNQNPKL